MKLKRWIKQKDLSPASFARIIGVNRSTITRIIRNEIYPRRALVKKISRATRGEVTAADYY